jgi:hypothetical protein
MTYLSTQFLFIISKRKSKKKETMKAKNNESTKKFFYYIRYRNLNNILNWNIIFNIQLQSENKLTL